MKVAILTADSNSACPVPAVKGGAVATLVEHLLEGNNKKNLCEMHIFSYYDKQAESESKKYKNIRFEWIRIPKIVLLLDFLMFFVIKTVLRKKKAISYKHIFSLLYYIIVSSMLIKMEDYDKIVIENNIMLAWIIKMNGNYKKYKDRYYFHFHNVPRINGKCKEIFQSAKNILCVSEFVGKQIQSSYNPIGPISKDKIIVLKNCINVKKFSNIDVSEKKTELYRKKYNIQENDIILLFVGRLSNEKGVDVAIKSLEYLPNNAKLIVAGSTLTTGKIKDSYFDLLNTLSKKYSDRVIFTGYIAQDELVNIYRLSKFAILPSIWEEPAGLTMIEGMASGIVVITTNSGGIPEYTEKGASVLLNRDEKLPEKIASIVIQLVNDNIAYHKMVINARNFVVNNFDSDNYINRFIESLGD